MLDDGDGTTIKTLIPRPRFEPPSGPSTPREGLRVEAADDPGLPDGAYRLEVAERRAVVTASSSRGQAYGRATLESLNVDGNVPVGLFGDAPALATRGIIEGFYGEPWSHEERLDTLALAERLRLDSYVYAPKDDPRHREQWREPYPDDELDRLAELTAAAAAHHVDLVYALHPAGSMRYSDEGEHRVLADKARQVMSVGVRRFALLFDDVPLEFPDAGDAARFGGAPAGLGRAHAETVARFTREVLTTAGLPAPVVVPTEYAGMDRTEYRSQFAAGIPDEVLVCWTGRDVVVGDISRAEIDGASRVFGERLALWDNFPVNDFDRGRAFLGPLTGRSQDLDGSGLRGAWTNPMVECRPGWFGIASFADWAWNPRDYDPDRSARAALGLLAGPDAGAFAPLVAALSSWPPSAPMDPVLSGLATHWRDGGADGPLRRYLETLRISATSLPDTPLARSLAPWADAARDAATAALRALDLAGGRDGVDRADVQAALARLETAGKKVATDTVPDLMRAVLAR